MSRWHGPAVLAVLALFLVGLAMFLPGNAITGNVVQDRTCGELGCLELCDYDAGNACSAEGTTCCYTHWDAGVCDYAFNCETVREYSLHQSLEAYQDSVRERPAPVDMGFRRFLLPLLLTFAIIGYFAWKRNAPDLR